MYWNLEEAAGHYGCPGSSAGSMRILGILKEIQRQNGCICEEDLLQAAKTFGVDRQTLIQMMEEVPGFKLNVCPVERKTPVPEKPKAAEKPKKDDASKKKHCLEICGGHACLKRAKLADFIRKTYGSSPESFKVKCTGCMHACGKAPNIKWDGKLYRNADEALIKKLVEGSRNEP